MAEFAYLTQKGNGRWKIVTTLYVEERPSCVASLVLMIKGNLDHLEVFVDFKELVF
jgi:hypothetical protein